ncbi:hypothetical protein [Nocardia sp. GAS34]|uniref:hypothetical protein n=1 Tax=unclassified Nocardia TaxID=2637762 RepID=UPI003D20954D
MHELYTPYGIDVDATSHDAMAGRRNRGLDSHRETEIIAPGGLKGDCVYREYTNLSIDAEDATDLAFLADRDATRAVGKSSDGRITIGTLGMRKFAVRIEPGTVRELTEIEFCAGVSEAAGSVIHTYQTKVGALKRRYYD